MAGLRVAGEAAPKADQASRSYRYRYDDLRTSGLSAYIIHSNFPPATWFGHSEPRGWGGAHASTHHPAAAVVKLHPLLLPLALARGHALQHRRRVVPEEGLAPVVVDDALRRQNGSGAGFQAECVLLDTP